MLRVNSLYVFICFSVVDVLYVIHEPNIKMIYFVSAVYQIILFNFKKNCESNLTNIFQYNDIVSESIINFIHSISVEIEDVEIFQHLIIFFKMSLSGILTKLKLEYSIKFKLYHMLHLRT